MIKKGDIIRAADLDRMRASSWTPRSNATTQRGAGGTAFTGPAGGYAPFWGLLSGTASPYAYQEVIPTGPGTWEDGPRSGVNAYEVNDLTGLDGKYAWLQPITDRDVRFRFQRRDFTVPCKYYVTVTVACCIGGVSAWAGTITGPAFSTAIDQDSGTWVEVPGTGVYTVSVSIPSPRWNDPPDQTIDVEDCGNHWVSFFPTPASGFYCGSCCCEPLKSSSRTLSNRYGTVELAQTGDQSWEGCQSCTGPVAPLDNYGNCPLYYTSPTTGSFNLYWTFGCFVNVHGSIGWRASCLWVKCPYGQYPIPDAPCHSTFCDYNNNQLYMGDLTWESLWATGGRGDGSTCGPCNFVMGPNQKYVCYDTVTPPLCQWECQAGYCVASQGSVGRTMLFDPDDVITITE